MIPGDLESAPILMADRECSYAFDWYTAAACVLSKTEGDDCQVSDPQAGMYFCSANQKVIRDKTYAPRSCYDTQEQSEFKLMLSTHIK